MTHTFLTLDSFVPKGKALKSVLGLLCHSGVLLCSLGPQCPSCNVGTEK